MATMFCYKLDADLRVNFSQIHVLLMMIAPKDWNAALFPRICTTATVVQPNVSALNDKLSLVEPIFNCSAT